MGNCVGGFRKRTQKLQHKRKVRKIRICVLGLDGAGKSTAVRALASEDITGVQPTNGFTLEEFKFRKAEIIAYDLGGDERIRSIWKNYYPEADVISDEDLSGKPILVLINKNDHPGCVDEIQLTDRLNLHHLANLYRTQIRVEVCQSNMGTGKMMDSALRDGFEWLLERIYDDYERLEKKVNEALLQLKRRQDEERMRRQHRLAATVSRYMHPEGFAVRMQTCNGNEIFNFISN
ncbi:unnamed protein product [Gongylonema pulchrum]|uniref:ADP-ribosylation factor n=1 Tax=Gongylonema pulchrum TaxID=637853 RepID=A0A183CZM5_9BILA|nr:unnamed protein product [Gongylonema pulchrum]